MDEQKKKKVLVAVLAVFVLGAGTYYVVLREPESTKVAVKTTGPTQRRQRTVAAGSDTSRKKTARKRSTRKKSGIENLVKKRERKKVDTKRTERRKRRGAKRSKTKKKEVQPFG